MPMISVKIMKTIDEREMPKKQKKNKQAQKEARGTEAIVKGWELKGFIVHLIRFSPVNM